MAKRAIYIYLPPGYHTERQRSYPVLYMHDGQNCFEAFAADSYAGSWGADRVAEGLIRRQAMRPCIIVGVSNGGRERIAEYLPPYALYRRREKEHDLGAAGSDELLIIRGRADQMAAYYRYDVAPYLQRHFRVLRGRERPA